jgi:hypothetical protein
MAWPSVKTTITPSHYAYIAVTLSFLFPPEVAESITRLTKNYDEAQNFLDHGVMYVHTYMLNTLKNVSLPPFSGMRLSEVCPSQKTIDTKKCLTNHIWRVGTASNNPQIATWGAWIPDNKSVSKRMKDRITEENRWNRRVRGESINSFRWLHMLENFLHIYPTLSKIDEEKDYKKIAKKEKKNRNKMLKLQTPKQKMKFSKNQPRYNNRRIR